MRLMKATLDTDCMAKEDIILYNPPLSPHLEAWLIKKLLDDLLHQLRSSLAGAPESVQRAHMFYEFIETRVRTKTQSKFEQTKLEGNMKKIHNKRNDEMELNRVNDRHILWLEIENILNIIYKVLKVALISYKNK